MAVGGSRRSGQKFLGGGGSQASGRSGSDNRSGIGMSGGLQNSGSMMPGAMASGAGRAQDPTYSHHMNSRETNDLNFMGS